MMDESFLAMEEEIEALEKDRDHWRDECSKLSSEALASAQRGVGQALMFALHAKNDADGNLVIEKADRAAVAEAFTK
jgi:hypothetical protein